MNLLKKGMLLNYQHHWIVGESTCLLNTTAPPVKTKNYAREEKKNSCPVITNIVVTKVVLELSLELV